jgi:hypothetical protein
MPSFVASSRAPKLESDALTPAPSSSAFLASMLRTKSTSPWRCTAYAFPSNKTKSTKFASRPISRKALRYSSARRNTSRQERQPLCATAVAA